MSSYRNKPRRAGPSRRTQRVAEELRAELSRILMTEIKDPRVRLATVSRVELSSDLSHARVFVSVLGDEQERDACIEAISGASGFLKRALNTRLRLRTTPELRFQLDRGPERSQELSELIASLGDSES